jgi:predicted ATPase/transcriptional regulator with XRE-family HTH domain
VAEPLGELLRSFRSAALLSQESLAERSGVSARTVSDIETGSARTPRLITVMLLAEAMKLSPADRSRLQEAAGKRATHAAGTVPRAVTLIGRDGDVARLCALLSRDSVRLVTLVGPAGVGKTSLATNVAVERATAFELGATMVELAPIAAPSLVPIAVARALGIRESGDAQAMEALNAYLRNRSSLIVLDNVEHVTPATAWIAALLRECPRLTVIATSREPLHLRAEHLYAVRPLNSDAAVTLFVQRAQMVKPDFEVTPENAAAVDAIVDHLEGLPLAIELAAPRLLLLPPKALAARLERRLPLLGDGAADRPERQRTMRRAIAWSYDLLAEDEQHLFRQLAVFQGGGTVEAAAAVASIDDGERSILTRLAPLVDKNMVSLVEDGVGEPRVSMLDMLREYAYERLAESGELADAQGRHGKYVLNFSQRANAELTGAKQSHALERFEREHANIRATLEWAARSGRTALGFELLSAVSRFWSFRGDLTEGVGWMRRFFSLRDASPASIPDPLYAAVLHAVVVLLTQLGNFDEALAPCEEAIEIQRRLGDDTALAASFTSLGAIFYARGEHDRAEELHAESLAIQTRLGDDTGVASSLSSLASVAFGKQDFQRTAALSEQSVAIYRRLGNEWGVTNALMKIGLAAAGERKYERAEEFFNECLRLRQAIGTIGSVYVAVVNLGTVAYKRGNYQLALARYHEALDLLDSMPDKDGLAAILEALAATISALGNPARGARLFGAMDALRRTVHVPRYAEPGEYDAEVAKVREALGAESFDVQWSIGTTMTLERALEEARETRAPAAVLDRGRCGQ